MFIDILIGRLLDAVGLVNQAYTPTLRSFMGMEAEVMGDNSMSCGVQRSLEQPCAHMNRHVNRLANVVRR